MSRTSRANGLDGSVRAVAPDDQGPQRTSGIVTPMSRLDRRGPMARLLKEAVRCGDSVPVVRLMASGGWRAF